MLNFAPNSQPGDNKQFHADALNRFACAMDLEGLACSEPIIADGQIHRFYVYGDRPGSTNGWYVFFGTAGAYGSWKSGSHSTWPRGEHYQSEQQKKEVREAVDKARGEYKLRKRKEQIAAAQFAQNKWNSGTIPDEKHPYLVNKSVAPYGIRQQKRRLLVPLFDFYGTLWNVQEICANGDKLFTQGCRVQELFCPIGFDFKSIPEKVAICEGWATGATVHADLSLSVLCAMNAGNLAAVARKAREHFPEVNIIVVADNDRFTDGNPGVTKALEAARLSKAGVLIPQFPEGSKGTDYNDFVLLNRRHQQ